MCIVAPLYVLHVQSTDYIFICETLTDHTFSAADRWYDRCRGTHVVTSLAETKGPYGPMVQG